MRETDGMMTSDFFQAIHAEVMRRGLTGQLLHTGGGVMVYHVDGPDRTSVGINEECVCAYVGDDELTDTVIWFTDDTTIPTIIDLATTLFGAEHS